MRSCLVHPCKPLSSVCVACVALLTMVISGWTTCTTIVNFSSCPGAVPQPQITSISPDTISANGVSVVLSVNGRDFVPQSQILWNGNALQTTFMDSRHLQATITQRTFDTFGGSAGTSVLISVMTQGTTHVAGCPNGGTSATLVLVVN